MCQFLTLYITPVIYLYLEKVQEILRGRGRGRKRVTEPEPEPARA